MTQAHTAGPWIVKYTHTSRVIGPDNNIDIYALRSGGGFFAIVHSTNADAQLIASAPDLLEALEDAARRMENIARGMDGGAILATSPQEILRNAAADARAAIAKARGQS